VTPRAGSGLDAEFGEQPARSRPTAAVGQRRHQAIGRFDQGDLDVLVGIDLVEPEGDDPAHVRCSSADSSVPVARRDDGDVELAGRTGCACDMAAQAGVDEPAVEPLRLLRRIQADRIAPSRPGCRNR